jgi:hypothetical protein
MTDLCLTINAAAKPIELGEISLSPGIGIKGADGLSAYEVAVKNGFEGSEQEYLASLKGRDGYTPVKGRDYWTTEDQASIVADVLAAVDESILGGAS